MTMVVSSGQEICMLGLWGQVLDLALESCENTHNIVE